MEKQSKGLIHIIWTLSQGGAEKFCLELARCSVHDRIIVVKRGENSLLPLSTVIYLNGNIYGKIRFLLEMTRGKTVFIWMYKSYLLFAPLSLIRNVVFCIHHDLKFWHEEKISTKISILLSAVFQRFFFRNPCIFVSEASRVSHSKVGYNIKSSEIIYNGVKDLPKLNKKKSTRKMIYVGRKDPIKNIDLAFKICCEMVDLGKMDMATFVGAGLDSWYGEELSERYDVDTDVLKKIRFLGFQTNLDSLYGESDLLILTSHSESCPMSVIEAVRSGLVIATTDVGDVRKMISNENIFFETEEEAVKKISNLFENPIKVQELQATNRKTYESKFDLKSVRKKYEASAQSFFSSK